MKSIRLLLKRLEENEIYTTDSLETAMYLLPNGKMISGNFYDGMRSEDHRAIFSAVDYPDYYTVSNPNELWKRLHREYRLVRLVPESMVALIKGRQRLTNIQREMLFKYGYIIEKY